LRTDPPFLSTLLHARRMSRQPRDADEEPARTDHPAAWRGASLLRGEDWQVDWTDAELDEIDAAIQSSAAIPPDELTREMFPLPTVGTRLEAIRHSLEHGCGATRVGSLRLAGRSDEEIERLFLGLGLHIGTPVSQSASGECLLHVRDEGYAPDDPRFRGPHSNRPLRFHTDRCDVIAFLCVRQATSGGENDVVSSMTLYDEMAARHPDALRTLCESFAYLRHTVDSGNANPFTMVPVFSKHAGHFAASLLRVLIDRADASPLAPDLTSAQRHALDTLEAVAEDPALFVRFRQEPGDVLFLNNWVTFHRRGGFIDPTAADQRRHLLRLWLAVPNSRPLDPRFEEHFGSTAAGAVRGGMRAEKKPD
jgi:Taurine catabolism dioxygenase TauD, TfdA family